MVEYIVAIDATRVRFPADAYLVYIYICIYMHNLPFHLHAIINEKGGGVNAAWQDICMSEMTAVGFEPTPFRNGALSHRLRPLGQTVLSGHCK